MTDARRALRRALALRPEDPKLYYALGLCCTPTASKQESTELLLQGLAAEGLTAGGTGGAALDAGLDPPRWTPPSG